MRGLMMFVPAVAHHFCLNLPATFSQPRTSISFRPSRSRIPLLHMCGGLVSSSMTVLHKRTSCLLYCPFMTHSQVRFLGLKITRSDSDLADRRRSSRFTLFTLRRRRRAIDAIAICNSNMSIHESHCGRIYHNHKYVHTAVEIY